MKLFLFVFALFGCVPLAFSQPLPPAELQEFLGKVRAKRAAAPQVQADFREEKTLRLMNKPVVSKGRVWFQAPDKFRREVEGNTPSTTVSDGQTLWIYYPKFESAERYALGKRGPLDAGIAAITASLNLQNVERDYQVEGMRDGDKYTLVLKPRTGALRKMLQQFTIRFSPALEVERTEMIQPNGDRIVTEYSNEKRAPIAPATFQFSPPEGTKITTPLGR